MSFSQQENCLWKAVNAANFQTMNHVAEIFVFVGS